MSLFFSLDLLHILLYMNSQWFEVLEDFIYIDTIFSYL
ncbi:hypothetical protein SAMN05428949_6346 [Chitinophaga sp. YR627]|nr:hypothetical protein SAMN05428949_6346 [Chitinophaga sp. YR627]